MTDETPAASQPPKIFTLSQVAASLQSVVARTYQGRYWVKAELARLHFYPHSGHCYPDLVEKSGDKVIAQFRAIIWADTFTSLNQRFAEVTGRPLQDGMSVLLLTSITFHPQYGLSIHIHDIEPSFTLGEMTRQRMAAITKLKNDGEFDLNHRLTFPKVPQRIAVISIETSKGYNDFCNILTKHGSRYKIHWELFPALLQGVNAGPSIIGKLEEIHREKQQYDLVVIVRGGGGEVGLDCYDDYTLARVVARFPLPVITGIGHASNQTVVEMVAHTNKITPTDVAYSIIKIFETTEYELNVVGTRLRTTVNLIAETEKKQLDKLGLLMAEAVKTRVAAEKIGLHRCADLLPIVSRSIILTHRTQFVGQWQRIRMASTNRTTTALAQLDILPDRLNRGFQWILRDQNSQLKHIQSRLTQADPEQMLQRGYSITMAGGHIIRSIKEITAGTEIETRLASGSIISRVDYINEIKTTSDE